MVDENGVNITPTQSTINNVIATTSQIKISPDRTMVSIAEFGQKKVSLYYFNSSSGTIVGSVPFLIIQSPQEYIYSAEFSENSNVLWFTRGLQIRGQDLNNLNQAQKILNFPGQSLVGTLQRGPDDYIYIASNLKDYLARINDSNNINIATLTPQALYLNGNQSRLGLPQLISRLEENPCPENLVLSSPEINNFIIYETSNTITTNLSYETEINQDITISAGNIVTLLPNTCLKEGSNVLVKIEGCSENLSRYNLKEKIITTIIDIDSEEENNEKLKLYPNPSNSKVHISLMDNSMTIKNISINSMDEKILLKFTNINKDYFEFDISTLRAGIYIVNVETKENGILVKKLIVN